MDLFKKLNDSIDEGTIAVITVRKTKGGMAVATAFSGTSAEGLAPFMLKGTAEELDEAYESELSVPAEAVKGLISNAAKVKASAAAAAKAQTAPKPSADTEKQKAERQKADEERRQKEELVKKLMEEAGKAGKEARYNTAAALLEKALELKPLYGKKKKDAEAKIADMRQQQTSMFCQDTAPEAQEALKIFVTTTEDGQDAADEADEPETETDSESCPDTEEETEENND